ncbi:tetratricopeptide repeat protein [Flavobacterium sp. P4023]|uniref:Tetratricopeptide repeat protein n=1 Tax=Flavobacterium flabelliforme TaxID=2816119 RepID=A0ABS5CPR4_9FLAO|nr:tetratricopeptide repeat protein [Flavobacterium flabelliforme]MBP4140612.1 tetratricopeptide repeat protein [Flavobacterium flabelliforme]
MNVTEFIYLINKPDAINEKQTEALEKVIDEFPYFQSARAVYLKGLYSQNSFKYNAALKRTASHSTDRAVLFDFITSDTFSSIDKTSNVIKVIETFDVPNQDIKFLKVEQKQEEVDLKSNTIEESILTTTQDVLSVATIEPTETIEEKLAIGQPLDFSKKEQHSFQEWLQLSRSQPIKRESEETIAEPIILEDADKRKKTELIDKFIETSPKISPVKHGVPSSINLNVNSQDNSYLMTETLARVYLEQKKYQKAIQAYEILILKYPEKSSFFADRISDIKILQHNNN